MIEKRVYSDSDGAYELYKGQGYSLLRAMINQELVGIFNSQTMRDMADTIDMYHVYEKGADFNVDQSSNDWTPAQWHSKQIKQLIDKEARFMFSNSPDIRFKDKNPNSDNKDQLQTNEDLLTLVLNNNKFKSKLVRAAKDCLIGKRIAIVTNFNEDSGITISFVPSLEFVYETEESNVDVITKFIQFYTIVANDDKNQQRIYKKKFWMENGICKFTEEIYDGNAKLIETLEPETETLFDHIPVQIIINDGLVNDPFGVSEVKSLQDTESWYSKLASKDIDSLRKGTDQITWVRDMDPRTTKDLSRAPGAFWDLQTDPATADARSGEIGSLDNPMSYSPALATTLDRMRSSMYAALDVPDTTNEGLQGIITSGKTMQAVYWGLMTRCNEKMLDWEPALRNMVETIIEGCQLYPNIKSLYTEDELTDDFEVIVEINYPIMQDDLEERESDMLEVSAKVRSRKSYMKKWMGLTEDEVQAELEQIQLEASMLEQETYLKEMEGLENQEGGNQ